MQLSDLFLIPLKADINLNYIWKLSAYRAENTLRLGYKNQPVNAV
jgi:hypothetical protein